MDYKFKHYIKEAVDIANLMIEFNGRCNTFSSHVHCIQCPLETNISKENWCGKFYSDFGANRMQHKVELCKSYVYQCKIRNIK